MEIKFKRKYEDDTRWPEIILDFLEYLSEEYEYSIDEYRLASIVWDARLVKIGKLLKDDPESSVYARLFAEATSKLFEHRTIMEQARLDYQQALEALYPHREEDEDEDS